MRDMAHAAARNSIYALLITLGCPLDKVKDAWKITLMGLLADDPIELCQDAIKQVTEGN